MIARRYASVVGLVSTKSVKDHLPRPPYDSADRSLVIALTGGPIGSACANPKSIDYHAQICGGSGGLCVVKRLTALLCLKSQSTNGRVVGWYWPTSLEQDGTPHPYPSPGYAGMVTDIL